MRFGVLGLWAFTNLEVAYALLRVEERRRAYFVASLTQRAADGRADGHARRRASTAARAATSPATTSASTLVLLGLWWRCATRFGLRPATALGAAAALRRRRRSRPTRRSSRSTSSTARTCCARRAPAAAGLYALAVKLATAVIVAVRGFQLAWPPLAYSIADDDEAGRLYAAVTTWYVVVTRPRRRRPDAARAAGSCGCSPRPSTSRPTRRCRGWRWAGRCTGSFLVFVTIAGRAGVTTRNFPAALAGWWSTSSCSSLLVEPLGIAGAGIALGARLRRDARRAAPAHARRSSPCPFEWRRLAHAVGCWRRRGRRRAAAADRRARTGSCLRARSWLARSIPLRARRGDALPGAPPSGRARSRCGAQPCRG